MRKTLLVLTFLFCCTGLFAQGFGQIEIRAGGTTLSSRLYDERHNSASWGMALNFGSRIGQYGMFTGGISLMTNSLYSESRVGGGYDSESGSFWDIFFEMGTLQIPLKLGVMHIERKTGIGFFANGGIVPEILVSRWFDYSDYSIKLKNSFGFGLMGEAGLAIRMGSDDHILTLSANYTQMLTRYRDYDYPEETFKRRFIGGSIGVLMFFGKSDPAYYGPE